MELKDLPLELVEKAKACQTPEELLALADKEGIELSEKQLEAVSGGAWDDVCWTDVEMPDNPTT